MINEVGNRFANDLQDERMEADAADAKAKLDASMKVGPQTAATGPKVRDEVGAGPAKQEAGAGEVTDQRTKDFMGLMMLLTALSNRDKKEDKAQ